MKKKVYRERYNGIEAILDKEGNIITPKEMLENNGVKISIQELTNKPNREIRRKQKKKEDK